MKDLNLGQLILRVSFSSLLIVNHGIPKLKNLFSEDPQFISILGMGAVFSLILATIAETIFPLLVAIGFKTRLATIPIVITMFVAGFIHHWPDSFATKEKPLLFLFGFITIAIIGAGKYSVDKK